MLRNKILLSILFVSLAVASQAQNKFYDWGFGAYGGLYSYSSIVESKISSPYQYNRGTQISVSKYINNNFDVELLSGITTTRYYMGMQDFEHNYESTRLYNGSLNLKYKLDNGYIIKQENYKISPYLKLGLGSTYLEMDQSFDVTMPVGVGFSVGLGRYVSFVYETSYNYNFVASNAYMTHAMGLKFNFKKVSRTRLAAQRQRTKVRKLARIEKYNKKKDKSRLAQVLKRQENNRDDVSSSLMKEEEPTTETDVISEPIIITSLADEIEAPKEEKTDIKFSAPSKREKKIVRALVEEKTIEVKPSTPVVAKVEEKVEEKVIAAPVSDIKPIKVVDDYCVNSDKILTEFGKKITFDVNSTRIRSRMHSALSSVVETISKCESTNFVIIAHTDKDGDADYNLKLANKRAAAVKAYLTSKGISADRLTILAYGEYASTSGDKAANRRISFKINKTSF
jgi:outer membrane protein OmpA-like peptidoglycan-associated protein